ncbi:MAG: hypothetical protein LBQ54_16165 [Planctomycetaceae bacterium]|nr:hypothetical protein [Planctomycetaceae bacterium]
MVKWLDLDDPLLLFVEPKFFQDIFVQREFESSKTMIRTVIKKLFGLSSESDWLKKDVQELASQMTDVSAAQVSSSPVKKETLWETLSVEKDVDLTNLENSLKSFESWGKNPVKSEEPVTPPVQEVEQPVPPLVPAGKKVFYSAIPGTAAFSSLALTIEEMSTEIASKSIKSSLLSGRENERKFKVHDTSSLSSHDLHFLLTDINKFQTSPKENKTISPPARILPNTHLDSAHKEVSQPKLLAEKSFTMEDVSFLESVIGNKSKTE